MDTLIARLEAAQTFNGKGAAYELLDTYLERDDAMYIWAAVIWLLEMQEPLRALDTLETHRALSRKPNTSTLNLMAFTMAEGRIRLDEALRAAQKAALLEPLNPAIIDTLGWVYFQQGQLKKAQRHLERAHALEPQEIEIAWHLATLYVEKNDFDKASAVIAKVRRSFTLSDRLRIHIKRLQERIIGKRKRCISCFQR